MKFIYEPYTSIGTPYRDAVNLHNHYQWMHIVPITWEGNVYTRGFLRHNSLYPVTLSDDNTLLWTENFREVDKLYFIDYVRHS